MATIQVEIPDEVMHAVAETAEGFACALRLAAAMYWYGRSEITMGTAAAIAGTDIRGFLTELSNHKQEIFVQDQDDIRGDLTTLAQRRARDVTGV